MFGLFSLSVALSDKRKSLIAIISTQITVFATRIRSYKPNQFGLAGRNMCPITKAKAILVTTIVWINSPFQYESFLRLIAINKLLIGKMEKTIAAVTVWIVP